MKPLALLLWIATACSDPPAWNVLVISIDSLRADHLWSYGRVRDTSPTLDRLASGGVRFAHASSPTSWTLPSHVTLLSGLDQFHHSTVVINDTIPNAIELISEVFQRNGYKIVGFYSGPFLHPVFGFDRGFDRYKSCQPARKNSRRGDPRRNRAWSVSHANRTNPVLARRFRRWLDPRASATPAAARFGF